jgi:hypothetical protein
MLYPLIEVLPAKKAQTLTYSKSLYRNGYGKEVYELTKQISDFIKYVSEQGEYKTKIEVNVNSRHVANLVCNLLKEAGYTVKETLYEYDLEIPYPIFKILKLEISWYPNMENA